MPVYATKILPKRLKFWLDSADNYDIIKPYGLVAQLVRAGDS